MDKFTAREYNKAQSRKEIGAITQGEVRNVIMQMRGSCIDHGLIDTLTSLDNH